MPNAIGLRDRNISAAQGMINELSYLSCNQYLDFEEDQY